jgi:deazaflavin-dependent oxidoreductase (nitroreductase family)
MLEAAADAGRGGRLPLDTNIQRALDTDLVIEITTTGRTSGLPRTLEIWFHRLDGRYYISGWPGGRDWYANLEADPRFRIRFTQSGDTEMDAVAELITDPPAASRSSPVCSPPEPATVSATSTPSWPTAR